MVWDIVAIVMWTIGLMMSITTKDGTILKVNAICGAFTVIGLLIIRMLMREA